MHILLTMGSDYQYEAAEEWFVNLDKLVKHVNEVSAKTGVTAKYSTMADYVKAKRTDTSVTAGWPLKTDDMFPYADGPHMFWSGYFTSRPALKRYIRTASSQLQSVRHLLAFTPSSPLDATTPLEEALGVVQHHDAVTGTEMQHVAFDYAYRIHKGAAHADDALSAALNHLLPSKSPTPTTWSRCELLNVSVCYPSQAKTGTSLPLEFAVYNPLAQPVTTYLHLPVGKAAASYTVVDPSGKKLPQVMVPSEQQVTNYLPFNAAAAKDTLVIEATLPPMSLTPLLLQPKADTAAADPIIKPQQQPNAGPFTIENAYLTLQFNGKGALVSVTRKSSSTDAPLKMAVAIEPRAYTPHHATGNHHDKDQPSGAYIFRPNASAAPIRPDGTPLSFTLVSDSDAGVIQEVRQVWSEWLNVTIRLTREAKAIEMLVTAGPLPVTNGTELIMHMSTDIKSDGLMYSDANGREMQERKRDYRPSWKFVNTEPAAGNYFPMTTAAYIKDATKQLTLLADASQGVGSLKDGELEVMVHRRLLQDDSRGVREPLNETDHVQPYSAPVPSLSEVIAQPDGGGMYLGSDLVHPLTDGNGVGLVSHGNLGGGQHTGRGLIVRAKYTISIEPSATAASAWRPLMDQMYSSPQLFFSSDNRTSIALPKAVAFLPEALPPNLQVITLKRLSSKTMLLRIGHQFGLGEDGTLSKPTTFDVTKLFDGVLDIVSVTERTLSNNQAKKAMLDRRKHNAAEAVAARVAAHPSVAVAGGEWLVESEREEQPALHSWRMEPPLSWKREGSGSAAAVTIGPLEIKTFELSLK